MGYEIVFAPHTQGWHKTDSTGVYYAVLDGRHTDTDDPDTFDEAAKASLADHLSCKPEDLELANAMWAGDFVCGQVLIVYYKTKKELTND